MSILQQGHVSLLKHIILKCFLILGVLILAGIELIFFIVASRGLCFGFVLKTVLITQRCFHHCWAKAFSASHPTPPARRLGVHKKLGRDTAGTADPTWPKGYSIPYGSCSVYKAGGRRRKGGGIFGVMVFIFPSNLMCDGAPLSWRWLNTCLPMGSREWIPCFALLVHSFCFTYSTVFISTHEFSLLPSWFSPLSHPRGSERAAVWCLVDSWG